MTAIVPPERLRGCPFSCRLFISSTSSMARLMRRLLLTAFLASYFLGGSVASAAIFDSFDPARHNRFSGGTTPNPTFLLDESQLSGFGGRAALISPRHFITAAHTVGSLTLPVTATFRGIDGMVRSYTSTSAQDLTTTFINNAGMIQTAPSDVRVYTLAPEDIVAPEVRPVAIALGSPGDFIGRELFVLGQNNQAGRNVIDAVGIASFDGGDRPTVNTLFNFDTAENGGTGGLGADEIGLVSGDSGFQSLIVINGEVALLGANFGITSAPDAAARRQFGSLSSLVSPYLDQLNAIVTADGQTLRTISVVTAIPEPGMAIALLPVAAVILFRRRAIRIVA